MQLHTLYIVTKTELPCEECIRRRMVQ